MPAPQRKCPDMCIKMLLSSIRPYNGTLSKAWEHVDKEVGWAGPLPPRLIPAPRASCRCRSHHQFMCTVVPYTWIGIKNYRAARTQSNVMTGVSLVTVTPDRTFTEISPTSTGQITTDALFVLLVFFPSVSRPRFFGKLRIT